MKASTKIRALTLAQFDKAMAERRRKSMLPKPFIFIFNFGRVLPNPELNRLADAAGAYWINYNLNFIHENPHAEQVRQTLIQAFNEIMAYAETGIPPTLPDDVE